MSLMSGIFGNLSNNINSLMYINRKSRPPRTIQKGLPSIVENATDQTDSTQLRSLDDTETVSSNAVTDSVRRDLNAELKNEKNKDAEMLRNSANEDNKSKSSANSDKSLSLLAVSYAKSIYETTAASVSSVNIQSYSASFGKCFNSTF